MIALLVALLVPSLNQAREVSRRAVCLSNVKSLLTGVHAYANDSGGVIPYGPTAPPPSPSSLYPVTGLVTSQLSMEDGRPMALGLLLDKHLGRNPRLVFCPGTDQPFDAQRELAKVGKSQAISSFFYRHGSNTLTTPRDEPQDAWNDRIRINRLGKNRTGGPIRSLIVDQNFLVSAEVPAFGLINRTNHKQTHVNAGYVDGRAVTLRNADRRYSVNVGRFPHTGPDRILAVLEDLDTR